MSAPRNFALDAIRVKIASLEESIPRQQEALDEVLADMAQRRGRLEDSGVELSQWRAVLDLVDPAPAF